MTLSQRWYKSKLQHSVAILLASRSPVSRVAPRWFKSLLVTPAADSALPPRHLAVRSARLPRPLRLDREHHRPPLRERPSRLVRLGQLALRQRRLDRASSAETLRRGARTRGAVSRPFVRRAAQDCRRRLVRDARLPPGPLERGPVERPIGESELHHRQGGRLRERWSDQIYVSHTLVRVFFSLLSTSGLRKKSPSFGFSKPLHTLAIATIPHRTVISAFAKQFFLVRRVPQNPRGERGRRATKLAGETKAGEHRDCSKAFPSSRLRIFEADRRLVAISNLKTPIERRKSDMIKVPALLSVLSRLDGRRGDGEHLAIRIVRREASQKAAVEAVCTGKLTRGWYTNQESRKRASIMSGDMGSGGAGHQASLATVSSRRWVPVTLSLRFRARSFRPSLAQTAVRYGASCILPRCL